MPIFLAMTVHTRTCAHYVCLQMFVNVCVCVCNCMYVYRYKNMCTLCMSEDVCINVYVDLYYVCVHRCLNKCAQVLVCIHKHTHVLLVHNMHA